MSLNSEIKKQIVHKYQLFRKASLLLSKIIARAHNSSRGVPICTVKVTNILKQVNKVTLFDTCFNISTWPAAHSKSRRRKSTFSRAPLPPLFTLFVYHRIWFLTRFTASCATCFKQGSKVRCNYE